MANFKHLQPPVQPLAKQQGIAMVIAIVIVSLITIVAASMLSRSHLDSRRVANMVNADQAMRYGVAAEQFVSLVLKRDAEDNKIDSPDEPWLQPVTLPIEEGVLTGQLFDQSGCFNINNLAGGNAEEHYQVLLRLLNQLDLESPDPRQKLAQNIRDWVDSDFDNQIPYGAEDEHYLSRTPAYRAANSMITSLSELRQLDNVNTADFATLSKHLCAIPEANTNINVNTASAELLSALSVDIDDNIAQQLYDKIRNDSAFESIDEDFMQDPLMEGVEIKINIDVKSQYFLAKANATIGNTRVSLYSLLSRNESGATEVIARTHGTF